jgi:hypothetical protein
MLEHDHGALAVGSVEPEFSGLTGDQLLATSQVSEVDSSAIVGTVDLGGAGGKDDRRAQHPEDGRIPAAGDTRRSRVR